MKRQQVCGAVGLTLIVTMIVLIGTLILTPSASAASKYKIVHEFNPPVDGEAPYTGVILDAQGNLYGTTEVGGGNIWGTAFKLTPNSDGTWTETLLHKFGYDYAQGELPLGGLVFDPAGRLYGTTGSGGAGCGVVFQMAPMSEGSWVERAIYNAQCQPNGPPIFDALGNLYGTTANGGPNGAGDVFKLKENRDGSWTETVLYNFTGGSDGGHPGRDWPQHASLLFDGSGNLYGTTSAGGAFGNGVVYELVPNLDGSWRERVLYHFRGQGKTPVAGLVLDHAGNLYGTTLSGGTADAGVVFELTPGSNGRWIYKVLHVFGTGMDGANSWASLVLDDAGNLYGTTSAGGAYGNGNVFKLTPGADGKWTERVLHQFTGGIGGAYPYAGLVLDSTGNLYGTTYRGGTQGAGLVFEITP
jgi:uncharacterized repeat protein (TIGR03803 family)